MNKNKGFTLIELLIVVSILAFLLVLIVILFRNQLFKGQDARRKGDLNRIRIAIEEYEKDHDCYPPEAIVENCDPGTGLRPYLDKIPCDPTTKNYYEIEVEDSLCPSWFRIYTSLANEEDNDIEDAGCTYGCGPDFSYNFYLSSSNAPAPVTGSSPEPTGSSGGGGSEDSIYGCFSGTCLEVGVYCEPNYQNSNCYDACTDSLGNPQNECFID